MYLMTCMTGRQKDIERENRIYRYCCKREVESEKHFLSSCPNYMSKREDFMTQLVLHDKKYKRDEKQNCVVKQHFLEQK